MDIEHFAVMLRVNTVVTLIHRDLAPMAALVKKKKDMKEGIGSQQPFGCSFKFQRKFNRQQISALCEHLPPFV